MCILLSVVIELTWIKKCFSNFLNSNFLKFVLRASVCLVVRILTCWKFQESIFIVIFIGEWFRHILFYGFHCSLYKSTNSTFLSEWYEFHTKSIRTQITFSDTVYLKKIINRRHIQWKNYNWEENFHHPVYFSVLTFSAAVNFKVL